MERCFEAEGVENGFVPDPGGDVGELREVGSREGRAERFDPTVSHDSRRSRPSLLSSGISSIFLLLGVPPLAPVLLPRLV